MNAHQLQAVLRNSYGMDEATIRAAKLEAADWIERAVRALAVAVEYGGIDGDHHKAWVIDQMVRHLAGDHYATLVAEARTGPDGPSTYEWDTGIAP